MIKKTRISFNSVNPHSVKETGESVSSYGTSGPGERKLSILVTFKKEEDEAGKDRRFEPNNFLSSSPDQV